MPQLGLSTEQLASMRADMLQLMPDTCTIQQPTNTKDGKGGFVQSFAAATGGSNVPCRLDPMSHPTQPDTLGGREVSVNQRMLTIPYEVPLEVDSQIVIGTETYQVRDIQGDHSWRVVKRAIVTKVAGV